MQNDIIFRLKRLESFAKCAEVRLLNPICKNIEASSISSLWVNTIIIIVAAQNVLKTETTLRHFPNIGISSFFETLISLVGACGFGR